MCSTKVIATCIFNKLLAAGLFPALDGTSLRTDPSITGRKYRKSVYNAVFINNKSSNVVSAAATSAFQLKHTPRLLGSRDMPCGLSNTDPRIWENISHVALWEILLARIRGISESR